jgi:hypothetical protein
LGGRRYEYAGKTSEAFALRGSVFNRGGAQSVLVVAVLVLLGSAVIAIAEESAGPLDAAINSKLEQLEALKLEISEAGCDYAVDEPTIEGCQQLDAQAQALGTEIETLKTRAHPSAKASEPQASRPYSFTAHTKANIRYRTFCVRECDGFYYPLGESSTRGSFLADEAQCRSNCSSPAKLFYTRSASDDAGEMVSLNGERYGDLANAFRYRSEYVSGCACKPKPWTAEAKAMFDRRAIIATRSPNERIVAAGAGEVAKLLTAPEPKVAIHVAGGRSRYSQAVIDRPLFRSLFRPFRLAFGAQAANETSPQHRFFLFRNRD